MPGSSPSGSASAASGRTPVRVRRVSRRGSRLLRVLPILVTGWEGAGKTRLAEVWETAARTTAPETGKSEDKESHHLALRRGRWFRARRVRVELTVAPGDKFAQERSTTLRRYLRENRPVGVVHVVCWGYNKPWQGPNAKVVRDARRIGKIRKGVLTGTGKRLRHLREVHLRRELADFTEICGLLAQAWRPKENPGQDFWLVVAVTKCDLYPGELEQALAYYGKGRSSDGSEFRRELDRLRKRVPGLKVMVVPVSSGPEPYGEDLNLGIELRRRSTGARPARC